MKAIYTGTEPNTITASHRKERAAGFSGAFIAVIPDENGVCKTVAEARIYWSSTFETCYCCLWTTGNEYTAGSGKAGGYGYHKPSAAMSEAIRKAGYKLDKDIHGCGDQAMTEAMTAIAESIVPGSKVQIIRTHP